MRVWFHSHREQDEVNEDESYDYDSWMDSKLFASLSACTADAERESREDAIRLAERYKESLDRYEGRKAAIELLKANGINPEELWFNEPFPPDFHEASERYIYSLEVFE